MENSLYRIVYCSRNLIRGDEASVKAELQNILNKARTNNTKADVTGALLYNAGSFAQVLEGPLDSIDRIFEAIQRDPRHSEVTVIQTGAIGARSFPEWSMAFAGNSSIGGDPAVTDAFEAVFSHQADGPEQLMAILKSLVVNEIDWVLLDVA